MFKNVKSNHRVRISLLLTLTVFISISCCSLQVNATQVNVTQDDAPVVQKNDFSSYDSFRMKVYGNADIIVKFVTENGEYEQRYNMTGGDRWQDFIWNITGVRSKLSQVVKIMFFIDGGTTDSTGTFYIDDVKLVKSGSELMLEDVDGNTLNKGWMSGTDAYKITDSTDVAYDSTHSKRVSYKKGAEAWSHFYIKPTFLYDNFDGNSFNNGWSDSGDGCYTITDSSDVAVSPLHSKKIVSDKGIHAWPYFYTTPISTSDYSACGKLKMKIYGNVNLLIKFETGDGEYEQRFDMTGGNNWQDLVWDISEIRSNLTQVNRILFFVDGGIAETSGTFYIDDLQLLSYDWTDEYEAHVYDSFMHYRLLRPTNYDPDTLYPVVVSLHGAGGKGVDNVQNLRDWNEQFVNPRIRTDYPAYVIVPQSRESWNIKHFDRILDIINRLPSVDMNRIYGFGHSMGSRGIFNFALAYPDLFAAIANSASIDEEVDVSGIKHIPIWFFCGALDGKRHVIGQAKFNEMVAAGGNMKFTTWAGEGHGVSQKIVPYKGGKNGATQFSDPEVNDPEMVFIDWFFLKVRNPNHASSVSITSPAN